jgi:protein O-mannosyl-transferase
LASGLVLLTLAAFEGVRHCGFVAFDDSIYLYRNPQVSRGLTWEGLRWAFGADLLFESPHADYWMPVTIVSRMLDVQMFGLDPAGHHAINALFHAINAVLVFLMLESVTAARWRSAFVAAMFAVHPLTVESVAWASERKNVLSALFWMLAVICYGRYARLGSRRAYAGALALMAVGLMAKPTLVMLPLVLLALDRWPLGRLRPGGAERAVALVTEKAPLFALSAASAAVTLLSLARGDHLTPVDVVPLPSRIANALWALVLYGGQVVWPARLAVLYPHSGAGLLSWRTGAALAAVGVVTWFAVRHRHSRPYLLTGLAWYALPLAPVLGLIQSGQQSHADRFMYIPLVGLGIVLAWGGWDLVRVSRVARLALPWAAAALCLGWVVLTRDQVRRWETTVSLFSHAVEVTEGNHLAHHNLATALALEGDLAGAERHYLEAVRIRPGHGETRSALGVLLMRQGRLGEALTQENEALRLAPSSADVHFNLAVLLGRLGRSSDAAARYADAIRLNPSLPAAHYNWGNLLAAEGRWAEAEARFREAVRLEPDNLDALNNLGLAIGLQGRWPQAADHFRRALAVDPDHARAHVNLGRALRELGRWDEARAQWREALARWPQDPAVREAREEMARLDSIRAPR